MGDDDAAGTVTRTKSFRGISRRLAVRYLRNLDGEPVDADSDEEATEVVGEGWRVDLSAETVRVGRSLELTEVTVTFEGDPEALEELVEAFSRKAMRAGG